VFPAKYWVCAAGKFPEVSEGDMLRKTINESSEPVEGRLGMENMHSEGVLYKPLCGEVEMCPQLGRMGPSK
jgi:hypothetical protein